MSIWDATSYKTILRERVQDLRSKGREISLKSLAEKIAVQYTFFSRVLNRADVHLNEDALYRACTVCEMTAEERDWCLQLRTFETSRDSERRSDLFKRLEDQRKRKRGTADVIDARESLPLDESQYLLQPEAIVLHAALSSEKFQKDARAIAPELGVTFEQLRILMRLLERNGFIKLGRNEWTVKAYKRTDMHFGRGHPIMRAKQALMKSASIHKMLQIEENRKTSLQATFTMDERGFELVRKELEAVYQRIQAISRKGRHDGVYQLGLDIFRWI